ncbi:hypothetical protein BCR32DRAFT_327573 [Anaeromyces robustus]|uniref:Uncharacterized protein n=1 Tax=Anaeromyces robustus TaxID=1754192 RepID=A0A1Y1X5W6_9FUNG|nr:hypothetical protein BCR32DRAFT_327573 [Anaeromyces robustus]|eukprot:ORX80756.1 hypothetical protein BCR32DRAFT_327573 [Anaeromyces robustus]
MNFKTIISVAVLALAAVNASPVNNIETIKKDCEADHKAKFYVNDDGEYTCLRQHSIEDNLYYRTCYFVNSDIRCVEEGFNNIPSCSKNTGDESDYNECARKYLEFLDNGSNKLSYRIRKFPTHEKIFYDYSIDQKECRGHNGIVLTNKEVFQYICLEPATPKNAATISDKECVRVDGKVYCVVQDNTNIEICNRRSYSYDHEECSSILKEYGTINHHVITEL